MMRRSIAVAAAALCAGCGTAKPAGNDLSSASDMTVFYDFQMPTGDAAIAVDQAMLADLAQAIDATPDLAAKLSFVGNTAAFTTGGAQIPLVTTNQGMGPSPTPSAKSVSVTTQTFAESAAKSVHLVYATDFNFTMNKTDLTMTFDKVAGNNDQWFAVIPAFPANTQFYFYVAAFSYTGVPSDDRYDPGNFINYTYVYN